MLKQSWHNLESFWEGKIIWTTLFISLGIIDWLVLLSEAAILKAVAQIWNIEQATKRYVKTVVARCYYMMWDFS